MGLRRLLHILLLLAVGLVFGVSFELLRRVVGNASPWLPLLLMFYFLALAKIAEPLVVLRMPDALRRLRPWELRGEVYRRMAVPVFGSLLRETPLRYLNAAVYLTRRRGGIAEVLQKVESAEASHFWAALLFLPAVGYAGYRREWGTVAGFLLAEGFVNLYPILHLRLVRGRLGPLAARERARQNRYPPN